MVRVLIRESPLYSRLLHRGGPYSRAHDVSPGTGGEATWNRVFKHPRREDGLLNHLGYELDPGPIGCQSRMLSLCTRVPRSYDPPPLQDPTVDLCPGPSGGLKGVNC